MDILCNYQGYQKCVLILYLMPTACPGSPGGIEQYHNIHVVYTKEAETADMFIERVTHEIGKSRRVRVATSDGMEQVIILGHGALRVSARMFHEEVQNVEKQIRALVQGQRQRLRLTPLKRGAERLQAFLDRNKIPLSTKKMPTATRRAFKSFSGGAPMAVEITEEFVWQYPAPCPGQP